MGPTFGILNTKDLMIMSGIVGRKEHSDIYEKDGNPVWVSVLFCRRFMIYAFVQVLDFYSGHSIIVADNTQDNTQVMEVLQ